MEAGEGVSQPIYEERDVSTAPTSPTAAATSDGSNDGEEEATPAAQPTASATVAATRGAHNDDYRCSIKGCKLGKHPIQMDTCSANELDGKQKCDRQVHYECYRQLVIKKSNWENSPTDPDEDANLCFCTITCSRNYKKANAGGKHWNNDGKGGKDDQNCSENLLVRLFLSDQEKYNAYRDPFPNTKKDVCEKWAEVIKLSEKFKCICAAFGGSKVRAALHFPQFAETDLLSAEEKQEFREQQRQRQQM